MARGKGTKANSLEEHEDVTKSTCWLKDAKKAGKKEGRALYGRNRHLWGATHGGANSSVQGLGVCLLLQGGLLAIFGSVLSSICTFGDIGTSEGEQAAVTEEFVGENIVKAASKSLVRSDSS